MAERWVALLRGINVGGSRRLAMADLRATISGQGATDVATYVQSGNVVFTHPCTEAAQLSTILASAIAARHGLAVPVIMRTGAQMERVATAHPDHDVIEAKYLHVVFFDRTPDSPATTVIDSDRFAPDRFVVDGSEAFVTYPEGSGRSALTIDVFERMLDITATARNMNSVRKIAALAAG